MRAQLRVAAMLLPGLCTYGASCMHACLQVISSLPSALRKKVTAFIAR